MRLPARVCRQGIAAEEHQHRLLGAGMHEGTGNEDDKDCKAVVGDEAFSAEESLIVNYKICINAGNCKKQVPAMMLQFVFTYNSTAIRGKEVCFVKWLKEHTSSTEFSLSLLLVETSLGEMHFWFNSSVAFSANSTGFKSGLQAAE